VRALADASPVHVAARGALGQLTGAQTVDALVDALANGYLTRRTDRLRWVAAQELGRLADLRAASALIRALGASAASVRVAAGPSLRRLEESASFATSLGPSDPAAAETLRQMRSARPADVLMRALSDRDAQVRREALSGLDDAQDPRAAEAMIAAL